MKVETSLFSQVIQDHLALKERNRPLEQSMPLDRYLARDPFENHPLFKTEEQARIEETLDEAGNGTAAVAGHAWSEEPAGRDALEDSLWGRSRDFDWGD